MVHALEKAGSLVTLGGLLVEVHEWPGNVTAGVMVGRDFRAVGAVPSIDNYAEKRQATSAVDDVITRGLFDHETEVSYNLDLHYDGMDHLRAAAQDWKTRRLRPLLDAELVAQLNSSEGGEIVVRYGARMRVLRRI